jgi:hypothetical protein
VSAENPFVVLRLCHPAVRCCNTECISPRQAGGPLSAARRPPYELINLECQINALGPVVTWGCNMVKPLNSTAKSKGGLERYPESGRGHLPTGNPAAIYAASKALHQKSSSASALLSASVQCSSLPGRIIIMWCPGLHFSRPNSTDTPRTLAYRAAQLDTERSILCHTFMIRCSAFHPRLPPSR